MNLKVKLCVVSLLLCFLPIKVNGDDEIGNFFLTLQWPFSYCNVHHPDKLTCFRPVPGDFKIHGLWPVYRNGFWPINCPARKLEEQMLKNKKEDIAMEWQALEPRGGGRDYSNLKFWKHEWEKHGSCSKMEEPLSYFLKAIELKKKLKGLNVFLDRSGIKPGGTRFTPKKLIEIIEKNYKVKVNLRCNFNYADKTVPQLIEIRFCFNPKFDLSSCKPITADKCGCGGEEKEILLPDETSLSDKNTERDEKDEL
ncbi:hypothetical protein LguiA_017211 [Lonicera macranthoides]